MKKSMWHILGVLTLFVALLPPQMAQATSDVDIYGNLIYQPGWASMENPPYGVYTYKTADPIQLSPVKLDPKLKANGGAVYIDGKYYMISYDKFDDGAISNVFFRIFDMENHATLIREIELSGRMSEVATDLTYDPVTDQVYGCFYQSNGNFMLSILDLHTGVNTPVAALDEQLVALAANREGELYGVGLYGSFYKVDKKTGALTEISKTGLAVRYAQSATIDYATGKFFWASSMHGLDERNGFYEIDTSTGKLKLIAYLPHESDLTGLYTTSTYANGSAPAKTDLLLNFPEDKTSGEISFSIPSVTVNQNSLTQSVDYCLFVDGMVIKQDLAQPGALVKVNYTFENTGTHYVKLTLSNNSGKAPRCEKEIWIGMDEARVSAVTAIRQGEVVSVSWKAPTQGVHGGYIPVDRLVYKVARQPDNQFVYEGGDLACTDNLPVTDYGVYWYEIYTSIDGIDGHEVLSNEIVLGKAQSLPYAENFNGMNGYEDIFTVIDDNGDNVKWFFNREYRCFTYEYSETQPADDWLLTPPFELHTDRVYELSFQTRAEDANFPEQLKVALGSRDNAEAMTQVLIDTIAVDWNEDFKTQSVFFSPRTEGLNYVGFLACSDINGFQLHIDNIKLQDITSAHAPAAPSNLVVVPGDKGELAASVSVKLPLMTVDGQKMSTLEKVELYSDGVLIDERNSVQAGDMCDFGKVRVNANGLYQFMVVAYNEAGRGLSVQKSVYLGEDTPAKVPNVKISTDDTGHVHLTWGTPSVGMNGGYVNPAKLTYLVVDKDATICAQNLTECRFTTRFDEPADKQELLWYGVQAISSSKGQGECTYSDTLFIGKPYPMPFYDSFAHMQFEVMPWNVISDGVGKWELRSYTSHIGGDTFDRDGGMVAFVPYLEGRKACLVTPKIDIKEAVHPTLRFYAWHNKNAANKVTVKVQTEDGTEHLLGVINQNEVSDAETDYEWVRYQFALDKFQKNNGVVQVIFEGENGHASLETVNVMLFDQVRIFNYYEQDLAVTNFSSDLEVAVGSPIDFRVELDNIGSETVRNYTVELYRGDKLVDSLEGDAIFADGSTYYELRDIPNADASETSIYRAVLRVENDGDLTNNTSADAVVTVLPGLPYIETLKGYTQDGKAVLSWQNPIATPLHEVAKENNSAVVEDFESYSAFSITNAGKWTLTDEDRAKTFGIQDGTGNFVEYPNMGSEMSFMVFNPSKARLNRSWNARSGKQVMAAFSSGYTQNDDWLISPKLSGAQTISFFANSPNSSEYGTTESMEVLYSLTDTKPASFTRLGDVEIVPGRWTEFEYALPENVRYFAIRCISKNQYVLYIDDVTYSPADDRLLLKGFNVYRNGKLLNDGIFEHTTFEDVYPDEAEYTYQVSAVYNQGESILSNEIILSRASSLEVLPDTQIELFVAENKLCIRNADQNDVSIYTTSGSLIYSGSGDADVSLLESIYIVQVGVHTFKVIID